ARLPQVPSPEASSSGASSPEVSSLETSSLPELTTLFTRRATFPSPSQEANTSKLESDCEIHLRLPQALHFQRILQPQRTLSPSANPPPPPKRCWQLQQTPPLKKPPNRSTSSTMMRCVRAISQVH